MSLTPSSLVYLEGERNIDDWEQGLEAELDCLGLTDYIFGTVVEPDQVAKPDAHKTWFTQRANAMKILLATLKNQAVITTLTINGWDRKNKDPKVLYDLIQSCIARVTNEARSEVLAEFLAIKRANFDTMASFLNRYTLLRKRVQDAKFEMTDDFEVTLLFNAVKHHYPVDARHWAASLEDKTLTVGGLLAKLSNIGNAESRTSSINVNIQMSTNGNSNSNTGGGSSDNKGSKKEDKRVDCPKCNKKMYPSQKHMACGHHVTAKADICWFCNPDKAPDTWRPKKDAIAKKAGTSGTAAGTSALGNNASTNLTTPATAAPNSALLYGGGLFMGMSGIGAGSMDFC
ncbi:hypothetical protein B0H65DRAFT_434945 [Neurospora tetraspora]|uniref:Uncharacterized protein n=1 Tax=Neurospora tetraspora TaxID=94610 RepID=A0AAE0MNF2_9PEZI|nr:hypothetical protein B0H65DRAFT_434945 [Neurospora tetraspora]